MQSSGPFRSTFDRELSDDPLDLFGHALRMHVHALPKLSAAALLDLAQVTETSAVSFGCDSCHGRVQESRRRTGAQIPALFEIVHFAFLICARKEPTPRDRQATPRDYAPRPCRCIAPILCLCVNNNRAVPAHTARSTKTFANT